MSKLSRVKEIAKPQYKQLSDDFWYHGWSHVKNVTSTSLELADLESADNILCGIASYCHDLGRIIEAQNGEEDISLEGCRDHARLSIEPTSKILNQIGISGNPFNYILEAVTVHSYWDYGGPNIVAKILRDSDKRDALGPWGVLRTSAFHLGENFVDRGKILKNTDNPHEIKNLAEKTLSLIKKNSELSKKYSDTGLSKVLEWVDKRQFHTDSAYELFSDDIKYTQEARDFLL